MSFVGTAQLIGAEATRGSELFGSGGLRLDSFTSCNGSEGASNGTVRAQRSAALIIEQFTGVPIFPFLVDLNITFFAHLRRASLHKADVLRGNHSGALIYQFARKGHVTWLVGLDGHVGCHASVHVR